MTPRYRKASAAIGIALAALLLNCSREITAPVPATARFMHGWSFVAIFPPAYQVAGSAGVVPFTRVHIVLLHPDRRVALDTTVNWPDGADELTLSLTVPLAAGAAGAGEIMSATLDYLNAQGEVVFQGGPLHVTVTPSTGTASPPPVQFPVRYTGPGSAAARVSITPRTATGIAGATATFTAAATDAAGQILAGTPIVFTSSAAGIAAVPNATAGTVTLLARGTAWIRAQTLTGQSDSAQITVLLPASRISLASGSGQTGTAGAPLGQPVVAKVAASDDIGVAGITVSFAAANGGTANPASAVSDASGLVRTTWTLGAVAGPQSLAIISAGLSGSPLTATATATAGAPVRLEMVAQPLAAVTAGASLGSVAVRAVDAGGNTVLTFNGSVGVGLDANPGNSALSGSTTMNAVNGVATFTDLALNRPGSGYALSFSSGGLLSVTSSPFSVAPGQATQLTVGAVPASLVAGATIAPAVVVRAIDAFGNTATSFVGAVAIGLGANTSGATLAGTLSRSAVAGVATFGDLSAARAGTNYTLVANANGLAPAASAPFRVVAGAPAQFTLVSGGGQTAGANTALPQAIVFAVRDAYGNGVPGVTVSVAVTTGGGSVSSAGGPTDASGQRSVTWTLGATGGVQTLTGSVNGLTSVAVTATATGATPSHLVISTQPPATVTAGAQFTVVVDAADTANALLPSLNYAAAAALATFPAGATLGGTTSLTATGTHTFSTLVLTKAGAYTLGFTSAGMTPATTSSFSVVAGAGVAAADSGNSQSGPAGSALANQFVVRFLDTFGNPVVGASVTWSVTAGGGAMSPGTSATDASGRARSTLTLGGAPGVNTVVAGISGNPSTATFTATGNAAAGYSVWTGATSTDWFTAGNWNPAMVPGPGDSVQIGAAANAPVIGSGTPVTVKHLQIFAGGDLRVSSAVTIKANLTAGGRFVLRSGGGALVLNGGLAGNVQGSVEDSTGGANAVTMDNGASACTEVLSGNFSTSGDLRVMGYCSLDTWGSTLSVGGNLAIGGTGPVLWMARNAADSIYVGGNFVNGAGSNAYANVKTGSIVVKGNLSSYTTIGTAGTSRIIFAGSSAQAVTQLGPSLLMLFGVTVSNPAGVTVPDGTVLNGLVDLTGGAITTASQAVAGNGNLEIRGTLHDPSARLLVGFPRFTGTTPMDAATHDLYAKMVTFDGTLNANTTQSAALNIHGSMQTYQYYTVNGYPLTVTGDMMVLQYAKLIMANAGDSVDVTGNVTFMGIASTLSAGTLVVRGNFAQFNNSSSLASFRASPGHTTRLAGDSAQTVSFQNPDTTTTSSCAYSCFGTLVVDKSAGSVTFGSVVKAAGKMRMVTRTPVSFGAPTGAPRLIVIDSLVEPGAYAFWPGIATFGNNNSRSARTYADSVTFAGGPAQTIDSIAYTQLRVAGSPTVSGGFSTTGDLIVQAGGNLLPNGHAITVGGTLSTTGNGVITMNSPADRIVANSASFAGGDETGKLTNGEIEVDGNFAQLNTNSTTSYVSSAPHKTSFGGASALTISFAAPGTSYFGNVDFRQSGGGITFASDIYAYGTLSHSAAMAQNLYSSGSTRLLSVTGLNQPGAYPMTFNNVALKLSDGTGNATFNNVTFTGFVPSPTGVTMLEFFRNSAGTYNFSNLTFTDLLAGIGRYIKVTGSQALTLTSPAPTAANAMTVCGGSCTTWYTGAVIWP